MGTGNFSHFATAALHSPRISPWVARESDIPEESEVILGAQNSWANCSIPPPQVWDCSAQAKKIHQAKEEKKKTKDKKKANGHEKTHVRKKTRLRERERERERDG
jgi:hypothetical protein